MNEPPTTLDIIEQYLKNPHKQAYLAISSFASKPGKSNFVCIQNQSKTTQEKIFITEEEVPLVEALIKKYVALKNEKLKAEKERRRLKREAELAATIKAIEEAKLVPVAQTEPEELEDDENQELDEIIEDHTIKSKVKEEVENDEDPIDPIEGGIGLYEPDEPEGEE